MANIIVNYLTNNECYKAGRKITPKGVMIHSTGAANKELRRYVQPDIHGIGKNQYNNHWNTARPDGQQVCPHAFIGTLMSGAVATAQCLPWNWRGWHAGSKANDLYIGIEICEGAKGDVDYAMRSYREALEVVTMLVKQYNIPTGEVIDHAEGYRRGHATNHSDIAPYWNVFGLSMNGFRADIDLARNQALPIEEPKKYYRVRLGWADAKSQLGAYTVLANAVRQAQAQSPYRVYDWEGKQVWP
jgi:N-acetylmuramoyl-L-alanine amidase